MAECSTAGAIEAERDPSPTRALREQVVDHSLGWVVCGLQMRREGVSSVEGTGYGKGVAVLCGLCEGSASGSRRTESWLLQGGTGKEQEEGAGLRRKAEELGLCPEGETKAEFQARAVCSLGKPCGLSVENGALGSSAGR